MKTTAYVPHGSGIAYAARTQGLPGSQGQLTEVLQCLQTGAEARPEQQPDRLQALGPEEFVSRVVGAAYPR